MFVSVYTSYDWLKKQFFMLSSFPVPARTHLHTNVLHLLLRSIYPTNTNLLLSLFQNMREALGRTEIITRQNRVTAGQCTTPRVMYVRESRPDEPVQLIARRKVCNFSTDPQDTGHTQIFSTTKPYLKTPSHTHLSFSIELWG